MKFKHALKVAGDTLSRNSPAILSGLAVAGVVGTVILAVKATPEAVRRIETYLDEKNESPDPKAILQLTWKLYIPAAAVGSVTVACIIGANSISSRRQAALMSLYTLTDTAFSDYKEKAVELLGTKAEQKIADAAAEEPFKRKDGNTEVIIASGGEVLCYDTFTGRYFKSDIETLRKAMNDINMQCINDMYASQNDFYGMIGLPYADSGNHFGWNTDHPMELVFTSILSDEGKPCLCVGYRKDPIATYHRIW